MWCDADGDGDVTVLLDVGRITLFRMEISFLVYIFLFLQHIRPRRDTITHLLFRFFHFYKIYINSIYLGNHFDRIGSDRNGSEASMTTRLMILCVYVI